MRIVLFLFTYFILFSTQYYSQNSPDIDKIDDAVVLIKIYDYKGNFVGHGSGFVIDKNGTVATNYHVVEGSYSMKIVFEKDGIKKEYNVDKIISGSKNKDLAKISIEKKTTKETFPYIKFSQNLPKKGDDCWAIGTPADPKYMNTVSKGLVSNLDLDSSPYRIQTNAEITHGSSGGVLINSKGEAIGVTSSGDGSEDGARASINFAIWIQELNTLNTLNKERLIDPNSIPCQLSFYTNQSNTAGIFLYVDGIYIGSFSKYFRDNSIPTCGQYGTITRNLYSGTHNYVVYYSSLGKYFTGTVTLVPGECEIFKVNGPYVNNYYNPYSYFNFNRKTFDDKKEFSWAIFSGISYSPFLEYTNSILFPLIIEKSIDSNRFALRTNLQFSNSSFESEDSYNNVNKSYDRYFGLVTDFKWIWNREYRFNYWIAPTLGLHRYKQYSKYFETTYDWMTGTYNHEMFENIEKTTNFTFGLRIGLDMYLTKRFYLTYDLGIGFNKFLGGYNDGNLILGYRFN